MKWVFFCLLGIQNLLVGGHHKGPTLRVLIAANVQDEKIGGQYDVDRVKRSLEVIADKIGFKSRINIFKKRDFEAPFVIEKLKVLSRSSKDILVFYYTGHGFNKKPFSSCWPTLCTNKAFIEGNAVIDYLRSQPKRAAIILFDCCNLKMKSSHIIQDVRYSSEEYTISSHDDLKGLVKLLLSTRGLVVGAAANVGEFALAHYKRGGYFTNSFFHMLKKNGYNEELSWNMIFQETSDHLCKTTYGCQHPIFALEAG